MKHKVEIQVPVEKTGFFGNKKTVLETRVVEVDGKTYRKMKRKKDREIFNDLLLYEFLLDDD